MPNVPPVEPLDPRRDPSPRSCACAEVSMTEGERRAVDVVAARWPNMGMRWHITFVRKLVADPTPLLERDDFERAIFTAYLVGENAAHAARAAAAFRAKQRNRWADAVTAEDAAVQRERSRRLDGIQDAAIYLKSQNSTLTLDEATRLAVGVITTFQKTESEACRG